MRLEDNFEGIRQKFRDYVIENGMEIVKNKRAELDNLQKNDTKKYVHDSNVVLFIIKNLNLSKISIK